MKITCHDCKDRSLILVMQVHFQGKSNLARIKLICFFLERSCKIKLINYDQLTPGFNVDVEKNSCHHRIQRFMEEFDGSLKLFAS